MTQMRFSQALKSNDANAAMQMIEDVYKDEKITDDLYDDLKAYVMAQKAAEKNPCGKGR